ncbi:gp53-like domain-containing protein [Yersinia enterocolitica]
MSKIERYAGNLRAFGSNAQGLERTLFGETTQADDLTSQVTNSFLRGWGIVGPSENPSMEDFNAAMYTMSQFIAYQHQMGIPEWDALQEYYSGSICVRNGEAYLSLVDSNIGSAPPSAKWTSVLTAKNALANLSGFLKSSNNLSEIKDAGPAAVAQTLLNLGLGDAAKRSVGTGANQIPDMSSFISSFAQNGYFKFPGGLIIQWGEVTGSTTATVPANFPIPFPNALMSTALAIDLIGPSYATLQNQTLGGMSVNTWNSAGNRAALAIRYIAIGW